MELILKRIAKRKGYTIGRLSLSPAPSPVGRGGKFSLKIWRVIIF